MSKSATYNYQKHIKKKPVEHKEPAPYKSKVIERPDVEYPRHIGYHQMKDHHLRHYKNWHTTSALHHEMELKKPNLSERERAHHKNLVYRHKWHANKIHKELAHRALR